jgi:hypothetical protein
LNGLGCGAAYGQICQSNAEAIASFHFLSIAVAGWMNRQQQHTVDIFDDGNAKRYQGIP